MKSWAVTADSSLLKQNTTQLRNTVPGPRHLATHTKVPPPPTHTHKHTIHYVQPPLRPHFLQLQRCSCFFLKSPHSPQKAMWLMRRATQSLLPSTSSSDSGDSPCRQAGRGAGAGKDQLR